MLQTTSNNNNNKLAKFQVSIKMPSHQLWFAATMLHSITSFNNPNLSLLVLLCAPKLLKLTIISISIIITIITISNNNNYNNNNNNNNNNKVIRSSSSIRRNI